MKHPMWNAKAVKAYETGQGVELVNEPYPHYVPLTTESEKQEPVGWIDSKGNMICTKINESCKPLYTTPQQRTWVGLMEEEIREILVKFYAYNPRLVSFAQEIQAKLKEKNT